MRRDIIRMFGPLAWAVACPAAWAARPVLLPGEPALPVPPLRLPNDHGAHLAQGTEWWTLRAELRSPDGQALGCRVGFVRLHVPAAERSASRFAPRQILAARAALAAGDAAALQAEQMARVSFGLAELQHGDLGLMVRGWTLARSGPVGEDRFLCQVPARDFQLELRATTVAPQGRLMAHGDQGLIRRDLTLEESTRYYSLPQLQVSGRIQRGAQTQPVQGSGWLDHGWGRGQMAAGAIGSDWIGMHLDTGGALMVWRMRREDGSAAWAGATLRLPGEPDRVYMPEQVRLQPLRTWRSPVSGADYPVRWQIELDAPRQPLRLRVQAQREAAEVDTGNGVGDIFWEGTAALLDAAGRRIGSGWLEMSGYAAPINF